MTRLEWFEKGEGLVGAKLGAVYMGKLVMYDIYKDYLSLLKKGQSAAEAKNNLCESTRYNYSTVCRAINWFEEDQMPAAKKNSQIYANVQE